ncbi:MAG: hypothetical protein PVF87_09825 [Acidimicrobiia bacterium]|jgi:hypothetical protein
MSFAATNNRSRHRWLALASAVGLLISLMVVVAKPALAHNGTVTWDCQGWDIDLANYAQGAAISITIDGGTPITATDWEDYSNSGTWDDSEPHNLVIVVDAYDDNDQPEYEFDSNGSFSPAWQSGEWSFSLDITTQDCFNPSCPPQYLEYKHEPVTGGTVGPNDQFTITLGTESNGAPDGQIFDWTSTVPVYQVIVKGGPGANVYDYSGAFSGTGLHAPVNPNNGNYYGLSHITFCWQQPQEPTTTTFSIGGNCAVTNDEAVFTISGNLGEGLTLEVAGETIDTAGPFSIDVGAAGDYDYEISVDEGFVLDEGAPADEGTIGIVDCTPPDSPPPSGWACIDGEVTFIPDATEFTGTLYETEQEAASAPGCAADVSAGTTFSISGSCALANDVAEFTISGTLGEGMTLQVAGETIDTAGSFSIDVGAAGDYPYQVSLDDGFELTEGSPPVAGTVAITDCTPQPPDEVMASIVVEVSGSCELDGNDGYGVISVLVSVDNGAEVVVTNSSGDLVGTFGSDGSVEVPEGATYTWSATPNEGFEFPAGSPTSGSIIIETCSLPESLPFTGLEAGLLATLATALLGAGLTLLAYQRLRRMS